MSDLRESGAIERDADLVGLLYKPNAKAEENAAGGTASAEAAQVNLLITKQRTVRPETSI
jgi:replicative DNA helicase